MFHNKTKLIADNPCQLSFGCCVTDFDNDGNFEIFICGSGSRNLVLKWNGKQFINIIPKSLEDSNKKSIAVAAADLVNL